MLNHFAIKTVLLIVASLIAGMAQADSVFNFDRVVEKAQKLAAKPYREPARIPDFFQELSYDKYQGIRFNPESRLWKKSNTRFQVMLMPAGLFYRHPVKINVIDKKGVGSVSFNKDLFNFSDNEIKKLMPANLGYAGFKLTYPLQGEGSVNQFLVFAGASYFRGVGSENSFGISARGIAVDTGLSSGEEFPLFTEFWLVRPSPKAKTMMLYALLDGPGLTGAYQFIVTPGKITRVDVTATLFVRRQIELLGIAPLTSMFLYGENTARPAGYWRTEVHDSDGLLLHDGDSGEWLWRPLINPKMLQIDYLQVNNPRGFGLFQRDTDFVNYHDLGARYDRRPSAWVEPKGDWGKGNVVLVQLPTPVETNDNIVAFWTPREKYRIGQPYSLEYSLDFGDGLISQSPMAYVSNTFVGAGDVIGGGNVKDSFRLVIDFKDGPLAKLDPNASVIADVTGTEDTRILEQFVEYNEPLKTWRLSILAKPLPNKPLSLRAFLKHKDEAVSETWTYRLGETSSSGRGGP